MRIDVNMYIVAVEPDAARAAELARSMANWVGGDCRIVRAADAAEARKILNRIPCTTKTRVLLAAEDLGGGAAGIDFLKQIKTEGAGAGLRLRGLLTDKPQEEGDDGIVRFAPEPESEALMYHFVHLLRSGGTDVAAVEVEGDPHSARMQRVKRFLQLNRVPFALREKARQDVTVRVGPTWKTNPSPLDLAKLLNFVSPDENIANKEYDIVIVGGGPAGMSAAISSAGLGLTTLVLEDDAVGGQSGTSINRIDNHYGFPGGVAASDLVQRGLNQTFNLDVRILPGLTATKIEQIATRTSRRFKVHWRAEGEQPAVVTAGIAVVASGRVPRRVIPKEKNEAENEDKYVDRGLYYDALPADADATVKGKQIAIVGAGDTAGRAAVMFAQHGAGVTMVVRGEFSMGTELQKQIDELVRQNLIVMKRPYDVVDFAGDEFRLTQIKIKKKGAQAETLNVDRVYALIGGVPSTTWLDDLDAKFGNKLLDAKRFIRTEQPTKLFPTPLPMQTVVQGLFAIGDVRSPGVVQRIAQAAGQGAAVAVSIDLFLKKSPVTALVDQSGPAFAFYAPRAFDRDVEVPGQSAVDDTSKA